MDLLLHPLKSELNFPIGQKHPLDFSPERWQCAIHGLDAIFFHASKAMSVPFHQSGRAHAILDELSTIIDAGFDEQQLQRSPHLVLLSPEWYQLNLKPVMAKWMLLWLEANHLCTRLSSQQLVAYLTSDGAGLVAPDAGGAAATRALQELHTSMERGNIDSKSFQLLNLCSDWLRVYLPHVLQKIDRVSFGLLSVEEHARLLKSEPHMPRSRFKLAIPFVGKDCPSRASEFAHPDIIISLTVLAYRLVA